jgi:hypothetical protein
MMCDERMCDERREAEGRLLTKCPLCVGKPAARSRYFRLAKKLNPDSVCQGDECLVELQVPFKL